MRRHLRRALRRFAAHSEAAEEKLWGIIKTAHEQRQWEKCIDLLRVAAISPALHDRIFHLVESVYDEKTSFEDKYRLLTILGQLGCGFSRKRLLSATHDSDTQIRAVSLLGLGRCDENEAAVRTALENGLRDAETPVRLAALATLATNDLVSGLVPAIRKLAEYDPWPKVRSSAVATVLRLPPDVALPILEQAEKDTSPMVRKAALEGAFQFRAKRADQIIERRLKDPDESNPVKLRAAVASGKRCQSTALPALFEILRIGAEPLAPFDAVETAVAAAKAMGEIGTPEAIEMLKEARKRSNPATDKAIDNALAGESRCRKKSALEKSK